MCYYAKTLLYSYQEIEDNVLQIEKTVTYKALASFSSNEDTLTQMDKIADLIFKKNKLLDLKERLDLLICKFKGEEKILIEYKYFKVPAPEGFDVTSRTYFRKQNRILKKFTEMLEKRSMSEDWFIENYFDIWFLKYIYLKQKKAYLMQEQLKETKRSASVKNAVQKCMENAVDSKRYA